MAHWMIIGGQALVPIVQEQRFVRSQCGQVHFGLERGLTFEQTGNARRARAPQGLPAPGQQGLEGAGFC